MDDQEVSEEVETPEVEEAAEEVEEEPNAVKKERTAKQIDKLKEHNKQLQEERDSYKSLFESSRPITPEIPVNQPVAPVNTPMIDEFGNIDGNRLASTLQLVEQRAQNAEQTVANLQKQTREREEKEATLKVYEKYPQLDPTNKDTFDPKMYQYVYNELAAKAKRGEMPTDADYMNAANSVYNDLYEGREDVTKKEEQKQQKTEEQKRQINATRPRSTSNIGYYENEEEGNLIQQVRNGKRGAVGELLRRRGL